jgi:hypothetical protein
VWDGGPRGGPEAANAARAKWREAKRCAGV